MPNNSAIGLRAHSGWAAIVVVSGLPPAVTLLDRRIIEIADAGIRGSRQPYHAAENLRFPEAEQLIGRCISRTNEMAHEALGSLIKDLRQQGHEPTRCGLLLSSGRPLPKLKAVLASHALIHSAEGEMFREALRLAARRSKLSVTEIRERELIQTCSATLGIPEAGLQGHLSELGKRAGPPWRQDQKYATLAAWLALAGGG